MKTCDEQIRENFRQQFGKLGMGQQWREQTMSDSRDGLTNPNGNLFLNSSFGTPLAGP